MLLRPTANLPRNPAIEFYEGIVDTDQWFGPLFTNIRICRTDTPVRFDEHAPMLLAQPVPQIVYSDQVLESVQVFEGLSALNAAEWGAYQKTIVEPNQDPDRRVGVYATEARRRGKCPHAARAALQALTSENSQFAHPPLSGIEISEPTMRSCVGAPGHAQEALGTRTEKSG